METNSPFPIETLSPSTVKAVAYLRCSGQGQVHGDTWRRQVAACDAHAKRAGLEIVRGFEDPAVSGTVEAIERPGFASMVAFCLAQGISTIVIEDYSRLARDEQVARSVRTLARARGLRIVSAATGEDLTSADSPEAIFMQELQAAVASLDKRKIVQKLAAARAAKRQQTGRCEGRKPFGSKAGEEITLREIGSIRARGGTLREIAATLNAKNLPSRQGGAWTEATLSKIVRRIGRAQVRDLPTAAGNSAR
jgi:DNA invertase Pin-like site-specific DNA recombinase